MTILVTGASGYLGRLLVAELVRRVRPVLALDLREPPAGARQPGVEYLAGDVRGPGLADTLRAHGVEAIVHLASIVTPGRRSSREHEYSVDVLGTKNVLEASVAAGVTKFVVTSSGAAYGYHADNPPLIDESQPLRGNREFAYAWHKRLVEEMLAEYRAAHPEMRQVVLRVGTVLGQTTRNQITDLFDKPRLIALRGSDSPFVFAWDQDVVACLLLALEEGREGVFNVAGDGALGMREIAARLGKPCVELPAWLIAGALALLKPLGLSQYGPEQVRFLRYRPVLDNRRLKEVFGYTPRLTSSETFDLYRRARSRSGAA
jgi:UDP-glucose 4-epimerase